MQFIKLPIKQRIDPFYFALEAYLLEQQIEAVFIWDVFDSVIIGKNQLLENEVHLDYLNKHNIKVYRRPSGGGAVFNDYNCIKYSFVSKRPKEEMYYVFLGLIKDFLSSYIEVEFSGRNDLVFEGMKFSGNAYYQTKDGHVLHGTILYDTDLSILNNVLNPSKLKLKSKGIGSVKSRVTNLKPYIKLTREAFREKMDAYFSRFKTITLTEEQLTQVIEKSHAFNSDAYIYGNNPKYAINIKERFSFGEVDLYVEIKNKTILDLKIYGDFFEKEPLELLVEQIKGLTFDNLSKILDMDVSLYIEGMKNSDLYNLIRKGF